MCGLVHVLTRGRVGMLACGVVEVQRCGDVGVCGSLK